MIFRKVWKKGKKILVKIDGLDPKDKDGTWASTTEKVYNWAEKHFEDGNEVEVEYNMKNGQAFVTKIMAKGKGTSKNTSSETSSEPTCSDCGKALKDDKYTKCYNCNKANPVSSSGSGKPDYKNGAPYGSLLPDEAKRRNKGICLSSACEAVKVMQGQVGDVEALGEMVITLAEKFLNKFFS